MNAAVLRRPHRLLAGTAAAGLALSLVACGSDDEGGDATSGDELTEVIFATGSTTGGPHFAHQMIGEELGFFEEEGIAPEWNHAGGNSNATAELDRGRAQFATGTPAFQLSNYAEHDALPGVNFFEYSYPMKWDICVPPDSDIEAVTDLAGRKVAIAEPGTADEKVLGNWLDAAGVSPDDVEQVVTGGDLPMGNAITDGAVDAALCWDSHRGLFDAAGIEYEVLDRPEGIDLFGGFYLQTTPELIESDRDLVVGFGRAVLKGTLFTLENPEAASAIYLDGHPEAGEGMSREEAVERISTVLTYRLAHLLPPDEYGDIVPGEVVPQEWVNEVAFAGLEDQISDPSVFYTNDLVEEINDFDHEAIREMAREYEWQ